MDLFDFGPLSPPSRSVPSPLESGSAPDFPPFSEEIVMTRSASSHNMPDPPSEALSNSLRRDELPSPVPPTFEGGHTIGLPPDEDPSASLDDPHFDFFRRSKSPAIFTLNSTLSLD